MSSGASAQLAAESRGPRAAPSVSGPQSPDVCDRNRCPPGPSVPVLMACDHLGGHPAHLSALARCGHMAPGAQPTDSSWPASPPADPHTAGSDFAPHREHTSSQRHPGLSRSTPHPEARVGA